MAKTEVLHAAGFILSEAPGQRSRDNGVLISGQTLNPGTVLGRIIAGAATAAAKSGGNTGGGTCTIDATTPTLAGAKVGVYTVRAVALVANGGLFEVKDPNGLFIGNATVGVTFADEVKFALADVGTDFALGDGFDITVPAGSGKYTQLDTTALLGAAAAAGILIGDGTATSADLAIALVTRDAEVNLNELTWPAGISDANKAIAVAQLAAAGVILR